MAAALVAGEVRLVSMLPTWGCGLVVLVIPNEPLRERGKFREWLRRVVMLRKSKDGILEVCNNVLRDN